jgi:hypothetical protein
MGFTSGTRDVGEDEAVALCGVPENGVMVRNIGDVRVFIGGPGVGTEGDDQGYPLDPGEKETFTAPRPKESPVVPAPEGDMDLAVLYARTAGGSGSARVSFISASAT